MQCCNSIPALTTTRKENVNATPAPNKLLRTHSELCIRFMMIYVFKFFKISDVSAMHKTKVSVIGLVARTVHNTTTLLVLVVSAFLTTQVIADNKPNLVALIIGNDRYDSHGQFPRLKNSVRDAELIAQTLTGMGFAVTTVKNASRSEMDDALTKFETSITPNSVAIFYFAGHGIEFSGKNYLMGINARLAGHSKLTEEAMDAETFAQTMIDRQATASFVILDCCRESPPAEWLTRGVKKRGLADVKVDGDVILAYSAKPGQAALDGEYDHSPYAAALARWLPQGLSVYDTFLNIRQEVRKNTAGQQRTWESGSFQERFVFPKGVNIEMLSGAVDPISERIPAGKPNQDINVSGPPREYIILTGAPVARDGDKYNIESGDKFWDSFVRASRTRFQQIQAQQGKDPNPRYTWLLYEDGYKARGLEDHRNYIDDIHSIRDKFKLNLIVIKKGTDVIEHINFGADRERVKIVDFEYFGHANNSNFQLSYSGATQNATTNCLSADQFGKIKNNVFARNAFVKSWANNSGEEISKRFYAATGTRMIGAIGLVDYFTGHDEELDGIIPMLGSPNGKWVQ